MMGRLRGVFSIRRSLTVLLMMAGAGSPPALPREIEVPLTVREVLKTVALSAPDEGHFEDTLRVLMESSAEGNLKTASTDALRGYLDQSFQYPKVFWGLQHEASSQLIFLERLNRFDHQNQEAYGLCLKLRWLSPRIHQFASACQSIGEALAKESQDDMAGLLSRLDRPPLMVTVSAGDALESLIESYRIYPFSEARLRGLIQQLVRENRQDVARRLLIELLELNEEALWNTERGGVYKDLVELFDAEVPALIGSPPS